MKQIDVIIFTKKKIIFKSKKLLEKFKEIIEEDEQILICGKDNKKHFGIMVKCNKLQKDIKNNKLKIGFKQ